MPCETVTAQEYKNFILLSLTLAEQCTLDYLSSEVIDAFWDMQQMFSGCDPELRYLLTRREALKLLMFCTARQVNNKRLDSKGVATTAAKTRMDGTSQRQATNSSSGRADSIFKQLYNDINNAVSDATTTLLSQTIGHDRSAANMADVGSGYSAADTSTNHIIRAYGYTDGIESESLVAETKANGGGCTFDFSANNETTIGDTDAVGVVGSLFLASAGTTSVTGWAVTGGRSVSQHFQTNYSWSILDRDGFNSSRIVMSDQSTDQQSSNRNSVDWFHALRDEHSTSQTQSDFIATGRGSRNAIAHADGSGTSRAESKSKESGSSQSTSAAHEDSEGRRESNATSYTVSDFVAAGQRFEHLGYLLQNTNDNIEYRKMLLKGRMLPSAGLLQLCQPDGWCTWAYMRKALVFVNKCPSYSVIEVEDHETCLLPVVFTRALSASVSSCSVCS